MNTITRNFNPDLNFWEMNPVFKTIKLFSDLFEKDKSKGKAKSSQLMWAIALFIDPNEDNPNRNLSEEDKRFLIAEDYLKDPKFDWNSKEIKALLEEYEERCLSIAEKQKVRLERKLIDRGNFINKTEYSLDYYEEDERGKLRLIKGTADQLDKMLLNTSKIYAQLKEIDDMLAQERSGGGLRGGAAESASEDGSI